MATDSVITKGNLQSYLHRCGYADDLLRTDYKYADAMGDHMVPLAAFADQSYDTRSSCLGVIDASNAAESELSKTVASYRGLGAPVLFALCRSQLQLWYLSRKGATFRQRLSQSQLPNFFAKHENDFSPQRIYRAKNLGRLRKDQQLKFVDIGLMPVLEEEMGKALAGLMERVLDILRSQAFTPNQLKKPQNQRWLFQGAFWLLCAKLLQDKGVSGFQRLDLQDIRLVLDRVERHYRAETTLDIQSKRQESALTEAATRFKEFSNLSNLTVEALGHVYEQVLVTPELRKALGIHATPQYLVDYIVWQLWPWIEEIPEDERVVLEPTCGHAPFLTSAMRLLRELYSGPPDRRHSYLKKRLVGIEKDYFAREIARLSLTLADIPNPNGWNLLPQDVFVSGTLQDCARQATILLCNPPFEDFSPREQRSYQKQDVQLQSFNKAAEVLWKTLPYMPDNSVFGVILPRAFLHKKNLAPLRELLLKRFHLREICSLPENVFSLARHKSAVLLGKKLPAKAAKISGRCKVRSLRVDKQQLDRFIDCYHAQYDEVLQSRFYEAEDYDLRVPPLDEVWKYCNTAFRTLGSIADGGQGLVYKGRDLPKEKPTISKTRFKGAVRGFATFGHGIKLTGLPDPAWMSLDPEVIRRPQWGTEKGRPQIIWNYARVSGGPWRMKALIDSDGHPVTSRFLVFRIKDSSWSLQALWAILNSPLPNAYVFCNSMERDNLTGTVRSVPIPPCDEAAKHNLTNLVDDYFGLHKSSGGFFQPGVDAEEAKRRLLAIDAEVMRLYDLPPKYEKQVLDLFSGWKRPGVDFTFKRYYPERFDSYIPLHILISPEYQMSTAAFTSDWVEKHRSPEVCKAMENAAKAFKE